MAERQTLKVTNTFLSEKRSAIDHRLETRDHEGGRPFTRPTYEVLGYVLTSDRWKNAITNVENDMDFKLESCFLFPAVASDASGEVQRRLGRPHYVLTLFRRGE